MCAGGTNSCDHSNLVPCLGLYSKHIRCKFMINTQKGCIFVAPCEHPNLIPCVGLHIASMHAGLHASMPRIPPIPQTKNYGTKCLFFWRVIQNSYYEYTQYWKACIQLVKKNVKFVIIMGDDTWCHYSSYKNI